ncbi:MAG: NUDIX hydrolase [Candidatus Saccharibacteria bacterium]
MDWSLFDKGVFLINLLGIIYDPDSKTILIGKRSDDPNLKGLSWVFPGGRPDYRYDLEPNMQYEIKENTGLTVDVKHLVYAKTYPEKREFLSIYYHCERDEESDNEQARGNLSELKWIRPTEVKDYFTTSLHPKVMEYLKSLE